MKHISDRTVALIVLVLGLVCISLGMKAQNVVRKGNTFIEQKSDSTRSNATKTDMLYTDHKGQTDTIYLSSKGKAFIWKVSKNTQKRYRKYLPNVTEQLNKK